MDARSSNAPIGKVLQLAVRHRDGVAPLPVAAVHAVAGKGFENDRHADPRSPRQLLIAGADPYRNFQLPPFALRENLLVDVDTAALSSGTLLRIGDDVVLRLCFQCEACGALDIIRPGLARAIDGARGMLARVVKGGLVRSGDQVRVLERRLAAMAEDWRERVLHVAAAVPAGLVIDYALLARLAGIQSSYCRAFPRLLERHGLQARALPARMAVAMPRWDGDGYFLDDADQDPSLLKA